MLALFTSAFLFQGSLLAPNLGVKELVGGSLFGGNSRFGLSVVVADLDFDTFNGKILM